MTYIAGSLVTNFTTTTSSNAGRLCFKNLVTSSNISATSELTGFPATNMANPSTAFSWEATDTTEQTITISNTTGVEVDYVGVARHNLGQAGAEIRVRFDGVTVSDWGVSTSRQAILYLFDLATPQEIQIDIRNNNEAAKVAVIFVGQSLSLERNIYVGHTPVNYGRDRTVLNGVSQSGEFLGEIVLNETLSTNVALKNLTPDWYRDNLDEYFGSVPRNPCFWAWRPDTYEDEIGYAWIEGNPRPVNQLSNGMMEISWNFRAIA